MRRGELFRQLQVAVMRYRRIPVDQPDLRIGILRPVLVGDEHLDALQRLFRIPMIAVEMRRRPDHAPKSIHAGEIRDEQILRDILNWDAPWITGALEQGFDFVFHPRLLAKIGAMLQVLELLLEIGTSARLRREPALGDLKVRHAGLVERIEKAAIAPRVARWIAAFENIERRSAAGRGGAGAIGNVPASDGAQQFEARRSPAAPAQIAALEAGA